MKQYIYTLSDPDTMLVRYIGRTNNLLDRYKRHLQKSYIEKYDKNTYKSNWIKSLLSRDKKPLMEILEICDNSNVMDLEIYWISQFRIWGFPLTNLSDGGEIPVSWLGKTHTQKSKDKIRHSHNLHHRNVIQYDLSGNIIQVFSSLIEASTKTGYHIALISNCCKKKRYYTVNGGHFWREDQSDYNMIYTFRYEGDAFDYVPYNKNIQLNSKKICQYNLDGSLYKIYDSVRLAALETGSGKSNITKCCRNKIGKSGKNIIVKGYTFRYFDETNGRNLI